MGTRGLFVFVYRGKYYVFYNHYDSYPSELGEQIVDELRAVDLSVLSELVAELTSDDANPDGSNSFKGLEYALNHAATRTFFITDVRPTTDLFIEWIYFIDLEQNKFVVHNCDYVCTFPLDAIPDDWADYFTTDNLSETD